MEDVADGIDADEHHDDADNAMDEDQADDGPAPSPAVHKAVAGELELALPYVEQYRPMFVRCRALITVVILLARVLN